MWKCYPHQLALRISKSYMSVWNAIAQPVAAETNKKKLADTTRYVRTCVASSGGVYKPRTELLSSKTTDLVLPAWSSPRSRSWWRSASRASWPSRRRSRREAPGVTREDNRPASSVCRYACGPVRDRAEGAAARRYLGTEIFLRFSWSS